MRYSINYSNLLK